ncbi:unnamed protein product [Pedinophyceae sp. YPF-701]|nr:unnamed protein product [Pedinophyceae sp. YPF-701]
MRGKLAISVIEAVDVVADAGSPPSFYVKVSIDAVTHATQKASGLKPKFTEDLEFRITDLERQAATVELLHESSTGDLIIGSSDVPLANPSTWDTKPVWLSLRDAANRPVGKLLVVMRFTGGATTPKATTPRARTPGRTTPRSARSAATTTAAKKKTAKKGNGLLSGLVGGVGTVVGGTVTIAGKILGFGGGKKKRSGAPGTPPRTPRSPRAGREGPSTPRSTTGGEPRKRTSKAGGKKKAAAAAVLPLAAGAVVGVIGYLYSQRTVYYEVQEGDTLCGIGGCYNVGYLDIYERNSDQIRDPDLIYPGTKIRVR